MARGKARRPDPAAISFEQFWQLRALLDSAVRRAGAELGAIPGVGSGAMGLTPDSVKARPDYRQALASYRAAESALREFNGAFAKRFARQSAARIRADREGKAAARLASNGEGGAQCR
jgi:hypothetical protein